MEQVKTQLEEASQKLTDAKLVMAVYSLHPHTKGGMTVQRIHTMSQELNVAQRTVEEKARLINAELGRIQKNELPKDMQTQFKAAEQGDLRSSEAQTGQENSQAGQWGARPIAVRDEAGQRALDQIAQGMEQRNQTEQRDAEKEQATNHSRECER